MPAIPELTETLTDGQVSLRLAAERDIPEILIAYQDDPRMHERLGEKRPPSGAELGSMAERAEAERVAGTRVNLTILEAGFDDCRGRIAVHHIDWEHSRAELGIWVAPQARNKGFARHALRLAGRWLFDACRLERVTLLTEPGNEALLRAAGAAGFVREGVMREHTRERGKRVDAAVLSLLPSDLEQ